jgi:hypothetical protein
MSTTPNTPSTTASAAATVSKLHKIGFIVELAGIGAFAAGTILSVHHYAIGALFVGGTVAFAIGWKLHKS